VPQPPWLCSDHCTWSDYCALVRPLRHAPTTVLSSDQRAVVQAQRCGLPITIAQWTDQLTTAQCLDHSAVLGLQCSARTTAQTTAMWSDHFSMPTQLCCAMTTVCSDHRSCAPTTMLCSDHCIVLQSLRPCSDYHVVLRPPHCAPTTALCSDHRTVLRPPHCAPTTALCSDHRTVLRPPHCAPTTALCSDHRTVLRPPHCAPTTALCSDHRTVLRPPHCAPTTAHYCAVLRSPRSATGTCLWLEHIERASQQSKSFWKRVERLFIFKRRNQFSVTTRLNQSTKHIT
jgi:hypothetical protein